MSENELINAVQNFIDIVKTDSRISVDSLKHSDQDFNGVAFWLHFSLESHKLARSATTLTLAYSLPPIPAASDIAELVAEIFRSYRALITYYLTLPKDQGHQLTKAVSCYLDSVKSSLLHFLELFVKALKESSGYPDLCTVGVLLEKCKQVSSLPGDNRQAAIASLQDDNSFMIDTVDEITAEMKNQINLRRSGKQGVMLEGENEVWTDTEFNIVGNSLRLAKLGRSATETALKVLKAQPGSDPPRAQAGGDSEFPVAGTLEPSQIELLDQLSLHSAQLNPQLDDLFASIYPPIDDVSLPSLVDKFGESLRSFLSCLESFPDISQSQNDLLRNILSQLNRTSQELKTLLVSNEILSISDLNIN